MLNIKSFFRSKPIEKPFVRNNDIQARDIFPLHINTAFGKGGAPLSAQGMVTGCLARGIESKMLVHTILKNPDNYSWVEELENDGQFILTDESPAKYIEGSASHSIFKHQFYQKSNIIHLHNLHGSYFDFKDVRKISKEKAVVWSVRDALLFFTDRKKLLNKKVKKPKVGEMDAWPSLSDAELAAGRKFMAQTFANLDILTLPVSKWVQNKIKDSEFGKNMRSEVVYNALDLEKFNLSDRLLSREQLGFDKNKIILLTLIDHGLSNPWKGADHVINLSRRLWADGHTNVEIIVVGGLSLGIKLPNLLEVPSVDFSEIGNYFSACDVYLCTSIFDALPRVCIEAGAFSKPVVAFSTGGIPEIVLHNKTGLLADYLDFSQLYRFTLELIKNSELRNKLGAMARRNIEQNFHISKQIDQLSEIYKEEISRFTFKHQ